VTVEQTRGVPAVVTMPAEGGGETQLRVPRLTVDLPFRRSGLLYRQRARPATGTGGRVDFVPIVWSERARVVREVARLPTVGSVVVCAVGVWPVRAALALAVADALRAGRGDRRCVVTYAERPLPASLQLAIPHEVAVRGGDGVRVRVVWEVAGTWEAPGWLAGLAARPGAS
jgi:hypothetical protein